MIVLNLSVLPCIEARRERFVPQLLISSAMLLSIENASRENEITHAVGFPKFSSPDGHVVELASHWSNHTESIESTYSKRRKRRIEQDEEASYSSTTCMTPKRSTVVQERTSKKFRGSSICQHGRQRSLCKECGGSSICEHSRIRSTCKECGGSSICEHSRVRSRCKECGGSSICEHSRRDRKSVV